MVLGGGAALLHEENARKHATKSFIILFMIEILFYSWGWIGDWFLGAFGVRPDSLTVLKGDFFPKQFF
jgi:hypothetical protein